MKSITRRSAIGAALIAMGIGAGTGAWAQSAADYTGGRPIKLIVPYTPGGGTDAVARAVADKITQASGWTVVVENRPGASGNIGMDAVAKSKADGLTIGMGQTANLAINPALMPKMPFDPKTDLAPVALVASLPVIMVVRADSKWTKLSEVVEAAKAQPDQVKQALAGTGTVGHLAGELLAYQGKFKVLNVPYKGASPALTDLLGGSTDFMFGTPQAVLEMIKGKRLRALAVTSPSRLKVLPDVPTVAESGYPGFEAVDWKAIVAPAATPPAVVQALNQATEKALANPAMLELLANEGSSPLGGSPSRAQSYIQAEQKKWAELIEKAQITLE
ncbi:tripartite-type tricarboxylate transporter receptor subunit TctC [Comamonas sp. BIGb0124]|uniref:Bug family tripartite tricarboxylate transporter substrate binding protein n=1 Tax=Comamonas sp. BIGb0124 TaxID=2485130 RepID=UPI000F479988|nr:tripartite tricarboxylate transporter substrate binding protein [Comamonas sp. BIGb0124]ROR18461.1 tripartite-type tricarboxylate transporter receptor subunit TctC [Comamonas sp. BIGb0124]